MRAVDHYAAAESTFAQIDEETDPGWAATRAITAAAHAVLALAGATALQSYARVGDDDSELDDWKAAAGGES